MLSVRRATTLIELMLALVLVGILTTIAAPRLIAAIDRLSVRSASQDVVLALAAARATATRRGDYVSFLADPRAGSVRVSCGAETLFARDLLHGHGVQLEASRESVTFAPTGLGWGAANTTLVVSRGGYADTVVTSRLGRVRRN
jgi:type II secretory pathway pseudopilin PulG